MLQIERRTISLAQLRAKAKAADKPSGLEGYAAVTNQVTDLGWFKESIAPGAFKRALAEKQDVRCLMNHDPNVVLGRTKSKTLTLKEDSKGLYFVCDTPATQAATDLLALVDRGDVDQCSFGFIARKTTWTEEEDATGEITQSRVVEDLDLFDVSPVTFPAYEGTSVATRSLWPGGMPPEIREHRGKKRADDDCQCDCPECQDGDCDECSNADCDDENCRCAERSAKPGAETHEKKTKRVDGEDLAAAAFVIVTDAKDPSTWKLPWKFSTEEKTKKHLRNALARFNQLKGVSDAAKKTARTKLVKLCKEHEVEVSAEGEQNSADPAAPPPVDQAAIDKAKAAALARVRVIQAEL